MSFTPTTAKGVCPAAGIGANKLKISKHIAPPVVRGGVGYGANGGMTASTIHLERFCVNSSLL